MSLIYSHIDSRGISTTLKFPHVVLLPLLILSMINSVKADDWNASTGSWFTSSKWLVGSVSTATDNVNIW